MLRIVTFVGLVSLCVVAPPMSAFAQTSSAASTARQTQATLGFLTSYRFHLNALRLVSNDDNFVWDTDFGGDMDVFDLQYVRGNVLVNFESIVGEQLRAIDPNQANYMVDLSTWWRTGAGDSELGATFHHVSRHLSDRDKEFAVAWNMLGVQYTAPMQLRSWDLNVGYRALKTIQRSFVDYTAEIGGSVQALRALHTRVSLMVGGELTLVSVDKTDRGRDQQVGGRFEIGARFPGGAGFGEVFLARERRIDANPFDLEPTTFTMLGFRFLSP
ncbi:MAG: hypothetical protein QF681_04225 [Vicinamibacterales bacterium]|jgi:hypothetical protein|nr:hypothetical protein [Vicinamibacterales bacterium]